MELLPRLLVSRIPLTSVVHAGSQKDGTASGVYKCRDSSPGNFLLIRSRHFRSARIVKLLSMVTRRVFLLAVSH